jgi:23S rRNA (uracil1939-C5)-methyltransferase
LKIGDRLTLRVNALAYGGDGVGRVGDFVVFVSGGLPEEECRVTLTEVHKRYARAEVETVLQPSPDRVLPPCPVFGVCGGCQWQMLSYSAQLEAKRRLVREVLERVGGLPEPDVEPVFAMDGPWRFRNKAQFPVDGKNGLLAVGYYRKGTHDLVEFESCLIQDPSLDRFRKAFKAFWQAHGLPVYSETSRTPGLRHLVGRVGQGSGELLVIPVVSRGLVPESLILEARKTLPEMVGIVLNLNPGPGNVILGERFILLWGRDCVYVTIGPLRLRINAGSFFQTNTRQTEVLYRQVEEMAGLTGRERVLDLYSGVGGIALFLAPFAESVLAIEESIFAYRDACENAKGNGIKNVEFISGKAEKHLDKLREADVVILDPPRSGARTEVLQALVRSQARRLVYVSCNPATLARDLKILIPGGYQLNRVVPVDLFPHSYHIEVVVRLDR